MRWSRADDDDNSLSDPEIHLRYFTFKSQVTSSKIKNRLQVFLYFLRAFAFALRVFGKPSPLDEGKTIQTKAVEMYMNQASAPYRCVYQS